jgi:hypothetical protein
MSTHRLHCLERQRRRDERRERLLAFFVAALALAPWLLLPSLA